MQNGFVDTVTWIRVPDGRILCVRSRGKDAFYVPGGKREPGETDMETLVREVEDELSVRIAVGSARLFGVYEAPAHGRAPGDTVRMTCYEAAYDGELAPNGEIEEAAWLSYGDHPRVAPAVRLIFDRLHAEGRLT